MNVKYGDKNLIVRYIQAFLQENYAKTIRASGIYDEYTHSKLIDYLNLPKVLSVKEVVKVLSTYDFTDDYFNVTYFFRLTQTDSQITLTSKSNVDGNEELNNFIEKLNSKLFKVMFDCGWEVSKFATRDEGNKAVIIVKQSQRKNIIPKDCISLINLVTNNYLNNFEIQEGNISRESNENTNHIIEMVTCKPNTEYIIAHRYGGIIPISIADSNMPINTDWSLWSNINTNKEFLDISVDCGQKIIYKTSENASTLMVQFPKAFHIYEPLSISTVLYSGNLDYNKDHIITRESYNMFKDYLDGKKPLTIAQAFMCHFVSILDVDNPYFGLSREDLSRMETMIGSVGDEIYSYVYTIDSYTPTENKLLISEYPSTITNFDTNSFLASYWKVSEKFFTYILLMSINEYSRESDILTAINMLNLLYPNNTLPTNGKYTEDCKRIVKDYQIKNNISFALGYIDAETEAKMNLDIDRNKTYRL